MEKILEQAQLNETELNKAITCGDVVAQTRKILSVERIDIVALSSAALSTDLLNVHVGEIMI